MSNKMVLPLESSKKKSVNRVRIGKKKNKKCALILIVLKLITFKIL